MSDAAPQPPHEHAAPAATGQAVRALGPDLNLPVIATVAVVAALLLAAIIIAVLAWFPYQQRLEDQSKSLGQTPPKLAELRDAQQRKISEYRWVDQPQGIAAIPIERAMDLIVAEHQGARKEP